MITNMEQIKTDVQILTEAATLLEQDKSNWTINDYFRFKHPFAADKGCSMCAHGAIAFCGNPEVKQSILTHKSLAAACRLTDQTLNIAISIQTQLGLSYNSLVASGLPFVEWCRSRHTNYANVIVAHYKALQVGLTPEFNDEWGTYQNVIEKLREASRLPLGP